MPLTISVEVALSLSLSPAMMVFPSTTVVEPLVTVSITLAPAGALPKTVLTTAGGSELLELLGLLVLLPGLGAESEPDPDSDPEPDELLVELPSPKYSVATASAKDVVAVAPSA